jgi:hypothetical protein
MCEQSLDFTRKKKCVPIVPPIQRLNPKLIAREKKLPLLSIVDGERKYPSKSIDESLATPFLKPMDKNFCIASGTECVATLSQLCPKELIVIYFSIKYDPDRTIFI